MGFGAEQKEVIERDVERGFEVLDGGLEGKGNGETRGNRRGNEARKAIVEKGRRGRERRIGSVESFLKR